MYLCRLETTMKRHQGLLIRTIRDFGLRHQELRIPSSTFKTTKLNKNEL